jgi:hypothetical protein
VATQAPAGRQFGIAESLAVGLRDRKGTFEHADTATLAQAATAARKLDAPSEKCVLEKSAAFERKLAAQGMKPDADWFAHGWRVAGGFIP